MKPLDDPEVLRQRFAGLLDSLARTHGDRRFSVAAGILRGGETGRRRIDDAAHLAEAKTLLATGTAKSMTAACRLVAQTKAAPEDVESMQRRLMRKYRQSL